MSILYVEALNKRDQRLFLATGAVLELTVENMHEVALYQGPHKVGRLRFEALSSLNNIEISPLYQLREATLDDGLRADAAAIHRAAVALFKAYTNGRIRDEQRGEGWV